MVENKKSLEEGQIVLCTVNSIAGVVVFVKVEEYDLEGAITFSEIAPGRIRNIREFVFPGKKIVCKVLRIRPEGVDLSLRRVKLKERLEFNEAERREKRFRALLKTIIKEKAEEVIEKIKSNEASITNFLAEANSSPKILERYLEKKDAEKIAKILLEKKLKEIVLCRKFSLSSKNSDGIAIVKEIINTATKNMENPEISYVAAGKYLLRVKTSNPRDTDKKINKSILEIENLAKQKNCNFVLEKG